MKKTLTTPKNLKQSESAAGEEQPKYFTNMYKHDSNFSQDELKEMLATLSIGDARHDFEFPLTGDASNLNLRNEKISDAINYGLPVGYTEIFDEEKCLSQVISEVITVDGNKKTNADGTKYEYIPITVANPNYISKHTSEHRVKTINGYEFTVKYTDVKPHGKVSSIISALSDKIDSEIKAPDFYNALGLDDQTIAIVVDAASIGLYEILNKGSFTGARPTVYYIYGAEVVNDPATKKSPDSKVFREDNNSGVILSSCVPIIPPKSQPIYNYNFIQQDDLSRTPYLNQFYTNFNFALSDIKENIKGKSIEYITNLDITGENPGELNPVVNSKTKNDITFLKSILNNFKKVFSKKNSIPTDDEKFLFSSGIQQKRSGDWLQVLLCAAIKDKLRKFKQFTDNTANTDITLTIQDVYFVTHDRIALAFALLNGINCFFTHHNSKNHFHSVFAYKLIDPVTQAMNTEKVANIYRKSSTKEELNVKKTGLLLVIKEYMEKKYNTNVVNIDQKLNDHIRQIINNINDSDNKNTITNLEKNYNVAHFLRDTRAIFSEALESIFIHSLLPDLSSELNKLNSFDIELLLSDSDNNAVVTNYNLIKSAIDNLMKKYIKNNISDAEMIKAKSDFKKSHIYKTAAEWTWDVDISNRQVERMANIENSENYKTDRNIFLYNLNQLNEDVKLRIAWIYYQLYTNLVIRCNTTTENSGDNTVTHFVNNVKPLGIRSYKKFRAVCLSFCIEVLLNLGGGSGLNIEGSSVSGIGIVTLLDDFLKKNSDAISLLITDAIVVSEDNDYNQAVNKGSTVSEDSEVDSGIKDIVDINEQPLSNTEVTDSIPVPPNLPVITGGGQHISGGAFETTIKQVTYPLMTLILNASGVYSSWQRTALTVFNFIGSILDPNLQAYLDEGTIRASSSLINVNQDESLSTTVPSEEYGPSVSTFMPSDNIPRSIDSHVPLPLSSQESIKDVTRKAPVRLTISNTKGQSYEGGGIQNLKKLYDSLPPLQEDMPPINYDKSSDVFKDNTICFHPLLPIYMLTQTYMSSINNENIEESLDFDVFVNYLKFLKKIKENVFQIYSGENNNNENKMEAYAIGLGLKQLLFVSNNNNLGYQNCLEVLNAEDKIYSSASSLTENLVSAVSGRVTYSETDVQLGNIFLNSDLFKQFARQLNVNRIFGFYADSTNFNLEIFRADVLNFSVELATQIISDRGLAIPSSRPRILGTSSGISSISPGISGISSEERAASAAKIQKMYEENLAKGIPAVQQEKTGSQEMHERQAAKSFEERTIRVSSPPSSNNENQVSSSLGNSSRSNSSSSRVGLRKGGKKTRKHRRHFNNKRTKRNDRRTRRRRTKKHKRARKNNRSRK
jgi:hypothetical protein